MITPTAEVSRRLQIKRTLVSWHLLSLALLMFFLSFSSVSSGNVNQDAGNSADTDSSLALLATTPPVNSAGNYSEEDPRPKAADCSVNVEELCQEFVSCSELKAECIDCDFNTSCPYGTKQKTKCKPKPNVNCTGDQVFGKEYDCRYCYQMPHWLTWCNKTIDCALNKPHNYYPARPFYVSTCWVESKHLCMGRRCFHKQLTCNWSQGYKWSTALLLSIFLGGFGVDRFYLGLWREGIGKLLSFGGLGVWTLVDVILIAVGYIGPWDGSLYI